MGMKKKMRKEGRERERKERKDREKEREKERKERMKERNKLLWIFKKSIVQTQPSLETLLQTFGPHKNHFFVKKGREEGGNPFSSITE